MSRKTKAQQRARAMQENTGMSYMQCLNEVRKQIAEEQQTLRPQVADDGKPLIVIRPKNPALAIQIANLAVKNNDSDLFESLPAKVEDYTVIGFLAQGGKGAVIDIDGKVVGSVKPGDSFVTRNSEAEISEWQEQQK